MDTRLKERLVGAAVLVALAVILIPEMLSGPSSDDGVTPASTDEQGVKRYTIDLAGQSRPGDEPDSEVEAADEIIETAAPPVEAVAAVTPEAAVADAPPVEPSPVAPAPVAAPAAPAAAVPVAPPAPPPPPAAEPLPWVVQVGSFANQATADRLSADLKRRGYDSFVVPFKPAAQTLYRVRIGPMRQRSDADAVVQKLKREGTGATVVANG